MKSLVYASPVDSDEALVEWIAVVAGDIREMPEVFANARQSLCRWLKPVSLRLRGPTTPVVAGEMVSLTCTVEGSRPAASITWFNRSREVEPQPPASRDLMSDATYRTSSTLVFIASRHDHQGDFCCQGLNEVQKLQMQPPLLQVFQQDGATCHTARATIDLLKDTFGDRLISRFGPVNWPPRYCDLTPLDYFLWGYVKSLVYADKPQTLDHLEDSICRVIADIRPQMLEKVIENWTSRFDYIRASRGSHVPIIIFKM
ncbi:ig-like domain-containing protein [Trichonephila clavipes]|nr:ig-like domain-containing protein [Trichonephila clavipes]